MKYNKNAPALIITAGGSSSRFGRNKLLERINGKEIILYTLDAFKDIELSEIIITTSEELKYILQPIIKNDKIKLVMGGKTRQESVFNGLIELAADTKTVIIHDGARPLVTQQTIDNCIKAVESKKAVTAAVKTIDTIKIVNKNGLIEYTPNREKLWNVQTPQVFDYNLILNAHKKLKGENFSDDACLLEKLGHNVYIEESEYTNIKITTLSDLEIVKNIINTNYGE